MNIQNQTKVISQLITSSDNDTTSNITFFPGMGSMDSDSRGGPGSLERVWKSSLSFDNLNGAYPIELLIELVQHDSLKHHMSSEKACLHALNFISDEVDETRIWKANYLQNKEMNWDVMKVDLLESFQTRTERKVLDKVVLLDSLTKGESEDPCHFLVRINFVVSAIDGGKLSASKSQQDHPWSKVLFYFGLTEEERDFISLNLDSEPIESLSNLLARFEKKSDPSGPAEESLVKLELNTFEEKSDHDFLISEESNDSESSVDSRKKKKQMKVPCSQCDLSFSTSSRLRSHVQKAHQDLFVCQICSSHFPKKSDLNKHCKLEHMGKQAICKICDKEMRDQSALDYHNERAHNPDSKEPFRLTKTSRSFARINTRFADGVEVDSSIKHLFTQIIKVTNAKTVYVCALCKEHITGRMEFTQHSRDRHNGRVAKCDVCDFTAKSIHHIARHRLAVHDLLTEGFDAIYCDKDGCSYKTLDSDKLPVHIASVHEKLRPWKCDVCPRDFGTKGSLKLHVERVHMGLRPKICEECGSSFKSSTELKLHKIRAHTKEGLQKHHMCDECGASYTMLTTLNKHVRRVHRQEKNVQCPRCPEKWFFSKCRLNAHIRGVHQLDKKYACSSCDRGFANNGDLRHHISVFHLKVKSYRCKVCNTFFTKGSSLSYHIGVQHMGFTQADAKRKRHLARKHEAFEHIKDPTMPAGIVGRPPTFFNVHDPVKSVKEELLPNQSESISK